MSYIIDGNLTFQSLCISLVIIVGVIDVIYRFYTYIRDVFLHQHKKLSEQEELEAHYQNCLEQHQQTMETYKEVSTQLNNLSDDIKKRFDTLASAEKHDINWWIKQEHAIFMKKGKIKISELDFIEARYADYLALGGNGTIPPLMKDLRHLPKDLE